MESATGASIPQLLEDSLKRLQKTQADLREALIRVTGQEIPRQTIHQWTTGKAKPSPSNLVALWEVLLIPAENRRTWIEALDRPGLLKMIDEIDEDPPTVDPDGPTESYSDPPLEVA